MAQLSQQLEDRQAALAQAEAGSAASGQEATRLQRQAAADAAAQQDAQATITQL